MQRGMVIVLDIEIDRKVRKCVFLSHGDIVAELLRADPHRLRVYVRPVLQEPAGPPVLHHVPDRVRQVPHSLPEGLPPDLLLHEFRQPPHGLGGHDPGIELGVGQLEGEELVHVIPLLFRREAAQRQRHADKRRPLGPEPAQPLRQSPFHPVLPPVFHFIPGLQIHLQSSTFIDIHRHLFPFILCAPVPQRMNPCAIRTGCPSPVLPCGQSTTPCARLIRLVPARPSGTAHSGIHALVR